MNSCVYRGRVRHRRLLPVRHEFEVPLFMMYLDLDELPEIFDGRWLWSARRPAPAWFRRADYLGDPGVPLQEAVRAEGERLTGRRPVGPIRMLTHLRYLGLIMNPVTFYYCFSAAGDGVETILAEITNTPWRERHTYALTAAREGAATDCDHRFAKVFHVSPFMDMDLAYTWRFTTPSDRLAVHMENYDGADRVFDASLELERGELDGRSLALALTRHPWMTARVGLSIYWHALRLRMKGAPYREHPMRNAA